MDNIFPLIKSISNSNIFTKTVSCWELALEKGGWNKNDLVKIPFTLLTTDYTPSIVEHTNGVTECAISMANILDRIYDQRVSVDMDYLISGAILHDVGKLLEYKEENGKFIKSSYGRLVRHPISGASLAAEVGLPGEIQHIIASHSFEGDKNPRSVESIIVHHADFTNFEVLGGKP